MARRRSIVVEQLGELVEDLLPLESGEPLQLHVEDRLRLNLREAELGHQPVARLAGSLRSANQRDHRVEMIERDLEPFEEVVARLGLLQLEFGPAPDDLAAELHEAFDQLEERQHLRPAADDRQHDDPEARLQRRVFVEVVENDLRHLGALQLDDDAHAVAIGFVTQIGDALDRLLADQVGNPFDQLRLVDLIRDLGEDDRLPVALLVGFDRVPGAHHDRAAAGHVGLDGALAADDLPRGREVGRRNQAHQIPQLLGGAQPRAGLREMRVLDQPHAAVDDLAEVVRRHVGGHANRDARRPVDQQVREREPAEPTAPRWSRRNWERSRRSPCRDRPSCRRRWTGAAPRYTASPPAGLRRSIRNCPAR